MDGLGARLGAAADDELAVVEHVARPGDVHGDPEVSNELLSLPGHRLVVRHPTRTTLVSLSASTWAMSSTSRSKSELVSHQHPTVGPSTRPSSP